MNQYGTGQNVPYNSSQQDADLVNNPRYTGQSAGTNPLGHDGRGPAEESRYGAAPLSTTGVDEYGNPRREGMVDKVKDAVGMGPHSGATGYDGRRDEPGYGTPGHDNYGQPRKEGIVDKVKDAVGMGPHSGTTGYDARRDQPGYGTPGYDNYGQPREGMVDKMKDAAGVGPHSGTTGYDARRDQPGYGTPGYDNYGQPREGMVDKVKDAVGVGPHSGAYPHDGTRGEDYTNVNHPSSATGFGGGLGHPHGTTTTGYDQSGLGSGLGTGHHHDHDGVRVVPGNIPMADFGERRVEPGYDASRGHIGHTHQGTLTGSPRKEGIVEKIKDAVGMNKHDNVAHTYPGTTMGTVLPNTYGTGEPGLLHHGNTASTTPGYSHNHMVDTGLGHERHPGSNTGYPHETLGERVEDAVGVGQHGAAGYPHNTTSEYPGSTTGYPHETMGDKVKDAVGVGPHHGVGDTDYDHERRGKGFEDTTGMMHDTKTGPGYDATRTGGGTGYDETNVDYPHNDANAYGIDSAPPKKGIMTKIKEKLHH
ncbi:hypothetical protein KC19_10G136800 [Ceratodon purpureus]|uniref:Dehydrin n=1 Tax=Ceratodon purpureus TaxID=3225 RepID=A0A8T0GNR8_CERPU|nr:hypothetical protein KC19_10G136800 [Ceratodon purpureus]